MEAATTQSRHHVIGNPRTEQCYFQGRKSRVLLTIFSGADRKIEINEQMTYELKNIHVEDIEDLFFKIEKSLDIKLDDTEHIRTFGELCDHIANKIQLDNSDDCTTQQAFYKLRQAISLTLKVDNEVIQPTLLLSELFPRKNRRIKIKEVEQHLGFRLNILRPPYWVTTTLLIFFLVSFVGLFFSWKIGVSGLIFSVFGLWLANKIGNEIDVQTIGQVAQKMTRENYLKSRRNSKTFNKKEIETILKDWFCNDLELDRNELKRETKFIGKGDKICITNRDVENV